MRVVVDTPVLSLMLRRPGRRLGKSQQTTIHVVRDLITDGRLLILGAVRQEVLTGIRDSNAFERLKTYLRSFPDVDLDVHDYEQAAEFANQCRRQGIQGSPTDFLICAAAHIRGLSILTTDRDFTRYADHVPVQLHPL